MAKFLVLYMAPMSFEQQMANATPEQMQAGMEPWMAWFGKYRKEITDMGSPLAHGRHVTASGASDSQSQIAGYSFIEANDMEAARGVGAAHPHFLEPGNAIARAEN